MDASTNINIVLSRLGEGTDNNPALPANLIPLVLAQGQHESENFSSSVFENSNNGYGYDYDASSDYQTGQYEQYGMYPSLDASTSEIIDYIYRRVADGSFPDLTTITTPLQYATLLKNAKIGAYYADSIANYSAGIASYYNPSVSPAAPLAPGSGSANSTGLVALGVVLALAFAGYLYFQEY